MNICQKRFLRYSPLPHSIFYSHSRGNLKTIVCSTITEHEEVVHQRPFYVTAPGNVIGQLHSMVRYGEISMRDAIHME
jgi:hypothetical protein